MVYVSEHRLGRMVLRCMTLYHTAADPFAVKGVALALISLYLLLADIIRYDALVLTALSSFPPAHPFPTVRHIQVIVSKFGVSD